MLTARCTNDIAWIMPPTTGSERPVKSGQASEADRKGDGKGTLGVRQMEIWGVNANRISVPSRDGSMGENVRILDVNIESTDENVR